jgi:hypothetical protein
MDFPIWLMYSLKNTTEQQNILISTDHFNRYAQAIPTRNQTARTTAEVLFNNYIVDYGIQERLHP